MKRIILMMLIVANTAIVNAQWSVVKGTNNTRLFGCQIFEVNADNKCNIYVSACGSGNKNLYKFDTAWTIISSGGNEIHNITPDNFGNVYYTITGNATNALYVYNNNQNTNLSNYFTSGTVTNVVACNDSLGTVYIMGDFYKNNIHVGLASYNKNGLWTLYPNSAFTSSAFIQKYMAVDKQTGTVYTTVHNNIPPFSFNRVLKYDKSTNNWVLFDTLPNSNYQNNIYADNFGNIYTTLNGKIYKHTSTGWSLIKALNSSFTNIIFDKYNNLYVSAWLNSGTNRYYVAKYDGTTWDTLGNTTFAASLDFLAVDSSLNVYTAGGIIDSLGGRLIMRYTPISTLPVHFISFNLSTTNEAVKASWQTANEVNVHHYEVQQSSNGKEFVTIGKVNAKNKANNEYSFNTNYPLLSTNYFRVIAVDNEGTKTYSEIKSCNIRHSVDNITIYPNPAKDVLNVVGDNIEQVTISSVEGKPLKQYYKITIKQLDISGLATGIYFIKIKTHNSCKVGKFIKE